MAEGPESELGDVATEIVELEYSDLAHPHLELQIIHQGSEEFRLPFLRDQLRLDHEQAGFPESSGWRAQLKGEQVQLSQPDGPSHLLSAGDSVELEGARVFLLDVRRPPIGSLHGVSAPYAGRVWPLADQQTWVGRKGKRPNHVELAHPTVSRSHATFWPDSTGRVSLLAEAAGPPTSLNGHELKTGQTARLSHGDLVGFGGLLFRFLMPSDPTSMDSRFGMRTLGGFSIQLGGKDFTAGLRNEKARWLLGSLGARWGESRAVDWLLGQFWPETTASRGRKNLGYTLGQVREALEIDEANFETLVLRTQTSVGLNPARLDFHDFTEVQRLTDLAQPVASRAALDRLVALYQGPFLPDCYDEWAELARRNLEKGMVRTLLQSAHHFAGLSDLDSVEVAFDKILQIDPMCEEAAKVLMEAALAAGKPEKVVATYQRVETALKPYDVEPGTELMKLYYRANLGI